MALDIPIQQIALLWENFLALNSDSRDLRELLTVTAIHFDKGTVARECGRVFLEEEKNNITLPIELQKVETLKKTRRIDGILPLDIPVPVPVHRLADELTSQLELLGMDMPTPGERKQLNNEISLSYLSLLHRREIQLRYGLNMEVITECPSSPSGGSKEELTLMAYLPNGKRITVFYSNLKADHWTDLRKPAIGYIKKQVTRRTAGGLQLSAG